MPGFCKNPRCCGRYTFYAENEGGEKILMPLSKVEVKTELRGALATTTVELNYINPHTSNNSLECSYMYPLEKTTVLAKLEASINDRII